MKRLTLLIVTIMAIVPPAHGYMITGNKLVEFCAGATTADQGQCRGFIFGAFDSAQYYNHELWSGTCVPSVPASQLEAVVTKYISARPERWHEPAVGLFVEAVRTAFPCN